MILYLLSLILYISINPNASVTTAMPDTALYPHWAANQPPKAEPVTHAIARTAQKIPIPSPSPNGDRRAVKAVPLTTRKGQQSTIAAKFNNTNWICLSKRNTSRKKKLINAKRRNPKKLCRARVGPTR